MNPIQATLVLSLSALAFTACKSGAGKSKTASAPSGSSSATASATPDSACGTYSKTLCQKAGEQSEACTSLKAAAELLPEAACKAALAGIDETLAKVKDARKTCDELVAKLCADLGPTTETCGMVTTATKSFPAERCKGMLEHYADVLGDLKRKEDANKPLEPAVFAKLTTSTAPAFGAEDAKVTVVEFSDFECPYCSRAADVAHQIEKKYGKKVRFVFRQFPLSFHQNAHVAAEASLAAHAQGKFWPFHDKLFANQRALDRASLEKYAGDVGITLADFKKALDDGTYKQTVDDELKLGTEVAVGGTPTMFVNGKRIADPTNFESIAQEIDKGLGGS